MTLGISQTPPIFHEPAYRSDEEDIDLLVYYCLLAYGLMINKMRDDDRLERYEQQRLQRQMSEVVAKGFSTQGLVTAIVGGLGGALTLSSGVIIGVGAAARWSQNTIDSLSKSLSAGGSIAETVQRTFSSYQEGSRVRDQANVEKARTFAGELTEALQSGSHSKESLDQLEQRLLDAIRELAKRL